ncbi:protein HEG homolog 1 [Tiliqua scincoides]|uniref:protein HEG homolog 1 n=1 Tax=Tiliqua scincoides TaxID=71010 RepID=UPI0034627A81
MTLAASSVRWAASPSRSALDHESPSASPSGLALDLGRFWKSCAPLIALLQKSPAAQPSPAQPRACEAPSIMPATCTSLLHQLSLLLLVGRLHLLVGSAPLAQFPAPQPPGSAAVPQEEASWAAAPSLLPGQLGSAQPSSGSGRARAPATSKPAIMSNPKATESFNTDTRTSSSPVHSTDTFSTFVSDEGRTSRVITNNTSVSEEAIGTTASYTEMTRSRVLDQESSSLIETNRTDSSQKTVDITDSETVFLKVHTPKTAVSSLSEDDVTATGNTDSSWDTDSTKPGLPTESLGTSSARVNRHGERMSPFQMEKVTLADSARTELVSQTEVTMSFDQTQFPSHATQSSRRSTTSSSAQFPNLSARVVLAHSSFSPNTAAEGSDQPRSSSKTEKSIFSSHTDSSPVLDLSVRGEESTLRTLRNIRSSYNATQTATTFSSETSSYSDFTDSTYVWTPEPTGRMNLSLRDTDSTEPALRHSQAPSETTVVQESHQPRSNSNTEESISSSHGKSLPVSGPPDRSGERTLRTLRDISSSPNVTQISTTSSSETSSSSELTDSSYVLTLEQKVETNLSLGDTYLTDATLMHSQAPLEITDAIKSQNTLSNISIETRTAQTESIFFSPTLGSRGGTLRSLTNPSKSTDATELSAFDLEDVSSLDLTQTSSITAHSRRTSVSTTEVDFTESSEDPLLRYFAETSIYSSSTKDLSRMENSHQPIEVSDGERRVSSASTDSVYLSTTFRHGSERTLRSLPDNSTSPDGSESSTYKAEVSESSDSTLTLPSMEETEEYNASLSEVQSTEPSAQHLPEHSSLVPLYLASPKDSSTAGNGPPSVSSSRPEARVSHSYTNSMYSSAPFSREQTLPPVINITFPEVTESTSSYMEKSKASEQNPSSSEVFSQRTDFPVQDFDVSVPSTETVQSLSSSRMPTYSSIQSEPSDTGTGYQSMSSTDTGKRISASHTDRTYISTTLTRGGERTLLSISNNSTSESSTFYAEISSPSESVQSTFSVTQSRGSNMSSSDNDFSAPSTEPLAVHSLKTEGYSLAASKPQTTQFYSNSESTSATTLSFLPSSSAPPRQYSLPSTPPPVWLSSSESNLPSSSSAFPLPPSSQTTLMAFSPGLSSTTQPPLPPFVSLLPAQSSASSLLKTTESFEASFSLAASEGTTGIDLSSAGSSHSEYNNQTGTYPLKDSTGLKTTGPSLLTETTEQVTDYSSVVTITLVETKNPREQNISLPGPGVEKNIPILTTSPMHLLEGTTVSETPKATTIILPSSATQKDVFSLEEVTTGEKLRKTTDTVLEVTPLASSTDYSVTLKPPTVQPPSSTKVSRTSGTTSKKLEMSSATNVKVTEHSISVTHPPKTFSPSQTTVGSFPTLPVPTSPATVAGRPRTSPVSHAKASVCTTDTCLNSGKCVLDSLTGKFQCQCSPGWQGEDCSSDIDECLSNPCPASATCTNTPGSFQCVCSLGYWMEKGKCNLVRTFVGQFSLTFNTTGGKYSELHHIEEVIRNLLNNSLSTLPGYYTSSVKASRQSGTVQVSVLSTFSLVSNITLYEIVSTVQGHIRACKAPAETCQFISNFTLLYTGGALCIHKDPECDKETSVCRDLDGIAVCQCKPGYFKYNKLDHSCRACEDGYKLENNICISCPFGLGGFNCGNPYQLITIVIAAAGGGLLLIMGIALIVTCCQKNKNDISKLIFKSGDFQMSPYAEYPKTPQAQDWGRETIEMQENGSTKNLLQMTDVYYMPTNVRNPEERNGVYPPYTGLPGSRHSCIYPGQYNPSFISDDSRRRDYF